MVTAFVLIEVAVGRAKEIAQSLPKIEGVKSVHLVSGPYDIIAIVEGAELGSIGQVVSQIRAIPGISRTTSCIVAEFKRTLHTIRLGGIWKGIKITEEDIKEARGELLKNLEEKW